MWSKITTFFKHSRVKDILISLVILFLFSALLYIAVRKSQSDTQLAQEQLLEQVKAEREQLASEISTLQAQFIELQSQIEAIDQQIQTSIVEREEKHGNISNARTIGAVDAILKRGRSATARSKAGIATSAGRIDSNPYK